MERRSKMITVYVAGSVYEAEYRKTVARKYSRELNLFDPLKEIETGVLGVDLSTIDDLKNIDFTEQEKTKIVEMDKAAVAAADIVTAYMTRYSAGTIMEILVAWNNQVPVYVIDPEWKFVNDIWIGYHTTKFFKTIDECYQYIIDSINGT
jgi:nucleoside 2-deoxyribosyltransferase